MCWNSSYGRKNYFEAMFLPVFQFDSIFRYWNFSKNIWGIMTLSMTTLLKWLLYIQTHKQTQYNPDFLFTTKPTIGVFNYAEHSQEVKLG